jgi:hypothetical protein
MKGFWLLVRIAGIVVGIATLLRVATNEGVVTYDPLFLAWMDRLRDIVELGFLTDLIGPFLHWGIDLVRSWGISVPDLRDEWRPAFVFSMLLFGAIGRHSQGGWLLTVAPVGALAVAVWAGLWGSLVPVAFVAVAFTLVAVAVAAAARGGAENTVVEGALAAVAAAFTVAVAAAAAAAFTVAAAAVAAAVAAAAGVFLFTGFVESMGSGWRAVFANANFNIGIDILFTMALAFVIAVAAANPPIW